MHYALEVIGEFQQESLLNAKHMMMNRYGFLLDDEEIEDITHRIEMLVANEEFLKLVDGECYREKALRFKKSLRYVDLLVKKSGGVWNVIDYKSSMTYTEQHHKQVQGYKEAIEEITGDNVEGYICYLLENEIKIVSL
jgi:exodeoxyribonuclease V beta subunit